MTFYFFGIINIYISINAFGEKWLNLGRESQRRSEGFEKKLAVKPEIYVK